MAFLAERLEKIREILLERKTVDVTTLCRMLEVSDVTIRKDLDRLEEEKFLTKIHGGAILSEGIDDRYFQSKETVPLHKEKQRIVEEAVKLIDTFDNIFIGPGSTSYLLAKMLSGHSNVRVITNNINTLGILFNSVKKVNVVGGEIGHRDNMMFSSGNHGFPELDGIHLNKAFITYNGIDPDIGFSLDEMVLVNLYEKVCSISREIIVLASSNKIGHQSMYPSAPLNRANCLITSEQLNGDIRNRLEDGRVRIIHAKE